MTLLAHEIVVDSFAGGGGASAFTLREPPNALLARHHYIGPCRRASLVYQDDAGVLMFAAPASRRLPAAWLELARWCILPGSPANAGSAQWRAALAWLRRHAAGATTVVSYSDPAAGHDGALYRACGWLWAPTWHRLRPPPSGNGAWTAAGGAEAVKDRWIYPLTPDAGRVAVLAVKDAAIAKAMPWACYREPRWKRGRPRLDTGGGDYKRWRERLDAGPLFQGLTQDRRRG